MTYVQKFAHRMILVSVLACAQAGAESHDQSSSAAANDNTKPAGTLKNGVLNVSLEAKSTMWYPDGDTLPGLQVEAFAESGAPTVVPGPLLRMPAGTRVELTVRNSILDTITFYLPQLSAAQSSAQLDSMIIPPGAVRRLNFSAQQPGNYSYRANTSDSLHRVMRVRGALMGALVVDPAHSSARNDRVFLINLITDSLLTLAPGRVVLNDRRAIMAINGRAWPHTERLTAAVGDSMHWRVINATAIAHPMHMHGFYYRVDDTNGLPATPLSKDRMVVTQRLAPFSAMTMTWVPERAGNWLFHCHIQAHMMPHRPLAPHKASAADPTLAHERHAFTGMGGLMMGIIVRGTPMEDDRAQARRKLRLVAIEDSGFPANAPSLRFRLEERGATTGDAGPGFSPPIVLERGKPVSITVVNQLREHTAVHWHGIELESYYDGVAGFGGYGSRISPIIAPRDSFEARFTPPRAGTFIYHSHVDELRQHRAGLLGALIVQEGSSVTPSNEFTFFLKTRRADAAPFQLEVNGQSDPDTVVLPRGRIARLRFINLTLNNPGANIMLTARPDSVAELINDPMLVPWRLLAKDGALLPESARQVTITRHFLSIGETRDFEVTPIAPGNLRIEVRSTGFGPSILLARVPVRVE